MYHVYTYTYVINAKELIDRFQVLKATFSLLYFCPLLHLHFCGYFPFCVQYV